MLHEDLLYEPLRKVSCYWHWSDEIIDLSRQEAEQNLTSLRQDAAG